MEITKEMRAALRAPLPDEAVTKHPTKTFLSNIKAIYVVERLNDVFGIGGWRVDNEIIEKAEKHVPKKDKDGSYLKDKDGKTILFPLTMVIAKSILTVPKYDVYIENYGGNDNEDLGDAYKGACTDALTKIGSYLEIGIDVFKGKHKPAQKGSFVPGRGYQPNKTITKEEQDWLNS